MSVRLLFPLAEDSPIIGGLTPIVVEVREQVNERGVFWTERLLIGVEGQVLLDTTQLSGGEYDPATQEMVYRVLAPWWTMGLSPTETFIWTQAQWVGMLLSGPNAPAYREGNANDGWMLQWTVRGRLPSSTAHHRTPRVKQRPVRARLKASVRMGRE